MPMPCSLSIYKALDQDRKRRAPKAERQSNEGQSGSRLSPSLPGASRAEQSAGRSARNRGAFTDGASGVGGTTRVRGFGLRPGGDGVQDGDKARRGGDLGARARPR